MPEPIRSIEDELIRYHLTRATPEAMADLLKRDAESDEVRLKIREMIHRLANIRGEEFVTEVARQLIASSTPYKVHYAVLDILRATNPAPPYSGEVLQMLLGIEDDTDFLEEAKLLFRNTVPEEDMAMWDDVIRNQYEKFPIIEQVIHRYVRLRSA